MLGQISSPRLLLRDVTPDDAQQLFELDQDPEVMRFLGGVRADGSIARTREMLAERVEWYSKTPGLGLGACFLRPTAVRAAASGGAAGSAASHGAEFIGWFMIRPRQYRPYAADGALLDARKDAELGYRLARRFWGQGYATEMSRALVSHGFQQLGLPLIVGFVDAEHLASVRVLQKAGLSRAGRALYDTEDVELYRVAAAEARKPESPKPEA